MQKFTPLYGLTVDCLPEQHEEHQDIQGMLSRHFAEAEKAMKDKNYNGVCAWSVPVNDKDNLYLTFITKYQHINLGIYNKAQSEIFEHCSLDDIKNIKEIDVEQMSIRIQNYAERGLTMEKDSHELLRAWGRELVRRQIQKAQEHQKSDIFTKPMDEVMKNASDRAANADRAQKTPNKSIYYER